MILSHNKKRQVRATISILWYFFYQGAIIGNWAALIPSIKHLHRLSDAVLGGVLLTGCGGAIAGIPLITYLNAKLGSAKSTTLGALSMVIMGPIMGVNGPLFILVLGVVLLGFGLAWTDVSMNSQAVLLEKYTGEHSLGLCHCIYALGGLFGALFGGVLSDAGVSPSLEFPIASAVCVAPVLLAYYWLFTYQEEKSINTPVDQSQHDRVSEAGDDEAPLMSSAYHRSDALDADLSRHDQDSASEPLVPPTHIKGSTAPDSNMVRLSLEASDEGRRSPAIAAITIKPLEVTVVGAKNECVPFRLTNERVQQVKMIAGLSSLGLLGYLGEGSIGDWSAVYLRDDLGSGPLVSALGYVCFQLMVAVGRFFSDKLLHYTSRRLLLQVSGVLAFLGLGLVSLAPSTPTPIAAALIGFTITGAGLSVVSPLIISAAGNCVPNMEPAAAIAYVSSLSYIGLMVGPPLIGGMTLLVGELRFSLLLDACLVSFISLLATFVPL